MTAITQKLSFADYLAYNDGTGTRYELVEGALSPMGLGTGQHGAIAEFLNDQFKVTICQLNEGRYDEAVFSGESIIQSPTFPDLQLTVDRVLSAR